MGVYRFLSFWFANGSFNAAIDLLGVKFCYLAKKAGM
jgi:hypothetical protein